MSTVPNDLGAPRTTPLVLSSEALDPRSRFDAWREELMLRVVRVDLEAPAKARFRSRLRVLRLPNVFVIEAQATPSVVKRTAELTRDGDDALVFTLYPGTIIITCCATGFYDGIDPPIFTGGTTTLNWAPGVYHGGYGVFTVALAPSAPEISTWSMMIVGFGALSFGALRRRASALRNRASPQPQAAR